MLQPILQIRQTPAVIGIDSDPGTYSIKQPKAEVKITTTPGELNVESFRPDLTIDQSRARAAYNGGSVLDMNKRIYSGIQQLYLQNLARKVEQGNRMAEFFKPGNTIAEVYGSDTEPNSFPEPRGPASYDNVDIHFETRAPRIEFRPAQVDIQVERNRPEIEYTRGKLDIYMQQYASVQFIPPEVNVQM
ncbi:hypothetical protein SAMN04487895_10294 [Paenibacillus sophorae]|uniref:Uncharacterized protein n=1 Tax=Paenibacillus sophorae TaxID=1333845 RepID=A0A1H8I632_9BACL|nr:DUF6470 family protein [Paenibacillus sophorae]QWU15870.1 hypothetical protein KP014_00870 [Paenibacillus sophorae]SEN64260.1 hypothetical protein SAMN04487895_10294 [Paenibacillus sophorae]